MRERKRILIIEDNESVAKSFDHFFRWKNYEVVTAPDGLEGLQELSRLEGDVDLILTDLIMPNISGIGLSSIAKKKYPNIPIIAITGCGRHAVGLAEETPVDMVLEKPIALEALEKAVNSVISNAVARRQVSKIVSAGL